jgi:hypothetical protein
MQQCWAQDPAQRPTFEAIARRLKAHIHWRILRSRHALTAKAARAAAAAAAARRSNTTSSGGASSGVGATGQQQQQQQQGGGKPAERLSGGLPHTSDDLSSAGLAVAAAGNAVMPSLPISSAIVGGISLAAVALPAALPHDALSSVAAQAGVIEGRRVMLVGSDLPNTRR